MTTEEIVWEEIDKVRNEKSALLLLIEEKDKEIAELKKSVTLLHESMVTAEQRGVEKGKEDYQKLKAENERLKGLIEKVVDEKFRYMKTINRKLAVEQFKADNNL